MAWPHTSQNEHTPESILESIMFVALKKKDSLENLRILSCFVQLKSVPVNVLCVFDLFFQNAGS